MWQRAGSPPAPTSEQHSVAAISFGTHSKTIFNDKGDSAFKTQDKNDQLFGKGIPPRVDEVLG
jgi:hypothetical protein